MIKIDSTKSNVPMDSDNKEEDDNHMHRIWYNDDEKKADTVDRGIGMKNHFNGKNNKCRPKKSVMDFNICNIAYDTQVQTIICKKYPNIGELWKHDPMNLLQFSFCVS